MEQQRAMQVVACESCVNGDGQIHFPDDFARSSIPGAEIFLSSNVFGGRAIQGQESSHYAPTADQDAPLPRSIGRRADGIVD